MRISALGAALAILLITQLLSGAAAKTLKECREEIGDLYRGKLSKSSGSRDALIAACASGMPYPAPVAAKTGNDRESKTGEKNACKRQASPKACMDCCKGFGWSLRECSGHCGRR